MAFTDREKFIQALAIFTVSPEAKLRSTTERSDILDYIRNTKCKSITNDEWAAISNELNKNKEWIISAISEYKTQEEQDDVDIDDEEVDEETEFPSFEETEEQDDEIDIDDSEKKPEKIIKTDVVTQGDPIRDDVDELDIDDDLPEEPKKTKTLRGLISKKK